MPRIRCLIYLFIFSVMLGFSQNSSNIYSPSMYLADPTILNHEGTYYLYGTTGNPKFKDKLGFLVYTSKDLKIWEGPKGATDGLALKKGDAFGDKGFWAPQVFKYGTKFYMAYTANEHIAMAIAESPLGPFMNSSKEDLKASVKQIDPFVFFDDDGKKYLYHVRLMEGNRIFVAELNDDLLSLKQETLTECMSGSLQWENTRNADWPVTEGPTVLKRNGIYYMIYSANDFQNPDYAVGYATSGSPLGPWKKSNQSPIIRRELLGVNGTGHGDVFMDRDGQMQYVLHTHLNDSVVHPRRTAILRIDLENGEKGLDVFKIDKQSFRFIEKL